MNIAKKVNKALGCTVLDESFSNGTVVMKYSQKQIDKMMIDDLLKVCPETGYVRATARLLNLKYEILKKGAS